MTTLVATFLALSLAIGTVPANSMASEPATPSAADPSPLPGFAPGEIARAARDFDAVRVASERDGGKLWRKPLYGPILLVDPANRRVLANQADTEGRLRAQGGIFVGEYPHDLAIANTGVDWAGVRWAMILLPLPDEAKRRVELIAHELFHRLQPALGLPQGSATVAHLDGLEGRFLLRLEWQALRAAIAAAGTPRREAIADALIFRARRRSLFPAGAEDERTLEMNEGLAEDTGCAIAGATPEERRALALSFLASGEKRPSFARSFAYASGPAYGLLLDELGSPWRKRVDGKSDLGALLAQASGLGVPQDLEHQAALRVTRYGGATLRVEEETREARRQERAAASRRALVDGPTLTLPLHQPQISFDPNALEPLDPNGTVYRTLEVAEAWGALTVQGGSGALVTRDWTRVTLRVPGDPTAHPLHGDGWTLKLSPGWTLAPGARQGDLEPRSPQPQAQR